MKKDGLVETKEGSSGGGYRFAKGAGEVSLAQVAGRWRCASSPPPGTAAARR